MGRPRKNERLDDFGDETVEVRNDRKAREDREMREEFEQEGIVDDIESPTHIPREEWPEGMALRWVAIEVANAVANANWSKRTASGWVPYLRGTCPKIDKRYPSIPMPGMEANTTSIVFGGLCLCQRPMRLEKRDTARQQKETEQAMQTVESYVEGGTSAVPRFSQSGPLRVEVARGPVQFKE